jgi:hypothetical protein
LFAGSLSLSLLNRWFRHLTKNVQLTYIDGDAFSRLGNLRVLFVHRVSGNANHHIFQGAL